MSVDQPAHMWSYWRDDKGLEYALRDYYPEALQHHPELGIWLAQIHAARLAIDSFMTERSHRALVDADT